MADEVLSPHPAWREIDDYCAGRLLAFEVASVEEHMFECKRCSDLTKQIRFASQVVDGWTAVSHGYAHGLQRRIAEGLSRAESLAPALLRSRLSDWRARWSDTVGGAVRLIVRTPGKTSELVTSGLEAILSPAAPFPVFELVPTRTRGETTVAESPVKGILPKASIAVTGNRIVVVVRSTPEESPPLIVLFPQNSDQAPLVQAAEWSNESASWKARITGIPTGDYIVALSPSPFEDKSTQDV